MSAATLALSIAKGESVTFTGTHLASATGAPVDISGWTITVTIHDRLGSLIATKVGTVLSGPAGTYSWPVTHADTTIASGSYAIDIWRTDAGSERLMGIGTLVIQGDVLFGS